MAGVRDDDSSVVSRTHVRVRVCIHFADRDRVGPDDQLASLGHGVPRVDREIHQGLLQHGGIGQHRAYFVVEIGANLDAFANDRLHHFDDRLHDIIQVDRRLAERFAAAEVQQLTCQRGGSVSRHQRLLEVLIGLIVSRKLVHGKLVVSADGLQEVVEFVSDAAGQRPDRFEFLLLSQLLVFFAEGRGSFLDHLLQLVRAEPRFPR